MRRPSFQFYPADWLGNTNLRRCTHAEKGVWLDVMCLMHDAQEYGVLRWPLKDIAAAVGCKLSDLKGLLTKGVLKGDDAHLAEPFIYVPRSGRKDGEPVTLIPAQPGPIWFSSRMVRDEHVRQHRGNSSQFGACGEADGETPNAPPKAAPMPAPMPPFGDGSSSSSSSSASQEGGKPQAKPAPAPRVKREKLPELTFAQWAEKTKAAGEKLISGAPVWDYARRIGLPRDFVDLAWFKFKRRYLTDPSYTKKRYADWRQTFRNAVEGNWFDLWYAKEGRFFLTTVGEQASLELDADEATPHAQEVAA